MTHLPEKTPNEETPSKGEAALAKKAAAVVNDVTNMAPAATRKVSVKCSVKVLKLRASISFQVLKKTNTSSAPIPRIMKTDKTWKIPINRKSNTIRYTRLAPKKFVMIPNTAQPVIHNEPV